MELSTTGIKYHEGYKVHIYLKNNEEFLPETGIASRFCFTFVEEGTGVLKMGRDRIIITSPSLYCFNDNDNRSLEQGIGIKARSVYFHPGIINGAFNLDNIRDAGSIPDSLKEDAEWLAPFIERTSKYKGQLLIGIGISKRIGQLLDKLEAELGNQVDWYWPCRSRSFFFEILLMVYRLYLNPQIIEDTSLPGEKKDIEEVLLYLNINYMNKITIESLEETFHINRTTLNEKFTALTGRSIKKHITHLRMHTACMLLRDTLLPVAEIMDRVGYNNANHFSRAFGKVTGISPSEYRNNNCWMKQDN